MSAVTTHRRFVIVDSQGNVVTEGCAFTHTDLVTMVWPADGVPCSMPLERLAHIEANVRWIDLPEGCHS